MIVLDTHALVWWLAEPARLSIRARRTIQDAARDFSLVASAISLFEIATAVRRRRLVLSVPVGQWLSDLLQLPELRVEPVAAGIAELAGSFDESIPGDPADRIIAATALVLKSTLVTADERLRRTPALVTVW